MDSPIDKTFEGRFRAISRELTQLDRRLGKLPDRLSTGGQEVTDWNLATSAGFYWGYMAANQPAGDNYWAVEVSALVNGNTTFQRADRLGTPDGVERWRYTKDSGATWSAWSPPTGPDVWTNLQGYLAPGITYVADGAGDLAGIRARRIGPMVELSLGNFNVDSVSCPIDGNIPNKNILEGIPAEFRPAGGAAISPGWAGRMWGGYVRSNGTLYMSSIVPVPTQTGTITLTDVLVSGTATYAAATP